MNDNEIIKDLEGMTYGGHSCMHCKYETAKGYDICGLQGCKIGRDALDLINRQKAEIERLKAMVQTLAECRDNALKEGVKAVRKAKSEAIKEFAEKAIDEFKGSGICNYAYAKDKIRKILKEMRF